MDLEFLHKKTGIGYLSKNENPFSSVYLDVRKKEHRILTDEDVKKLPLMVSSNPNHSEWKLRQKSSQRFIDYLKTKPEKLQILDIGCGNGWFTNSIAETSKSSDVIGLDINHMELEQAARVFQKGNLQFVYGDIFQIESKLCNQFDIITLNACIQYFSNFKALISKLISFSKPNGEIHIIDSPFYRKEELDKAKKRTKDYYTELGFPEMASNYFHHCFDDLEDFKILYNPKKNILIKLIRRKDSPFYWLKKSVL